MSTSTQPFRIGGFTVRCFHNCTHAPGIHAELKKQHIDAAVIDHAFVMSPLQLAVALFRVESNTAFAATSTSVVDAHTTTQSAVAAVDSHAAAQPRLPVRRMSYSRRIFASLSTSHNLDRILQLLPPGPLTTSVVIVRHSPCAAPATPLTSPAHAAEAESAMEAAIDEAVRSTNPTAVEHSFHGITQPFWECEAVRYVEVAMVMEFYGVSEAMVTAAQLSLTRRDVRRVCEATSGVSEEAQRQALRWHALQLCVTTQLAACSA